MEEGFNSPSRKRETRNERTSQAQKVTRQGRHKGAGKGTTSSLLTKRNITWGPSHTPFGGTRWLVDSYSRCGCGLWGRQRPTAQSQSYSHKGTIKGSDRTFTLYGGVAVLKLCRGLCNGTGGVYIRIEEPGVEAHGATMYNV
eukprot:scaffold10459_cov132-Isochrysis_galbana.AAC.1